MHLRSRSRQPRNRRRNSGPKQDHQRPRSTTTCQHRGHRGGSAARTALVSLEVACPAAPNDTGRAGRKCPIGTGPHACARASTFQACAAPGSGVLCGCGDARAGPQAALLAATPLPRTHGEVDGVGVAEGMRELGPSGTTLGAIEIQRYCRAQQHRRPAAPSSSSNARAWRTPPALTTTFLRPQRLQMRGARCRFVTRSPLLEETVQFKHHLRGSPCNGRRAASPAPRMTMRSSAAG
jgi:hypothetical protein